MLLSLLIYGNIGVKGVMGMDKKQEYKPIYSDLVDDSQVSCASEKTKTGVSYLPSEKEQEMQNESARQEKRAERIGIIVFTAVALLAALIIQSIEIVWLSMVYVSVVIITCVIYRFVIPGRPMHKDSFPVLCIFLTGIIVYLILTSGSRKYYGESKFGNYEIK